MIYVIEVGMPVWEKDENGELDWAKPSRAFTVGTKSRAEAERICAEYHIDPSGIKPVYMLETPIGYETLEAR